VPLFSSDPWAIEPRSPRSTLSLELRSAKRPQRQVNLEACVSKVKTPQDKKRLSYEHDRRNTYGENQKSSRKNIPRSKQLSHQDERRAVRQALIPAQGDVRDEVADEAQSDVLRTGRIKKLSAFRKSPDRPLGEVVARRLRRRRSEPAED
jgi:hypothetical protein